MMIISKLLPLFVYPVGFAFTAFLAAMLFFKLKKNILAYVCGFAAIVVLYIFSISPTAYSLVNSLESKYPVVAPGSKKAEVIVVLGGPGRPKKDGRQFVEFGEAGERIFDGIRWWKSGAAPVIITSGGGIDFIMKGQKEGEDLKTLITEFGVPSKNVWAENEARNTYENALYTRAMMIDKGLPLRIVLVTSAIHMPRSYAIFKKAGFDAVPAPCDFIVDTYQKNWFAFLPRAENLHSSTQAIKEYIGIASYKILGWL
ncbi:MAG: YdcF family protein [Fibrobacteres bacterium]|nr:YdcF family protein [Fibrobacterota bacterium]